VAGCKHANNTAPCPDGNACNGDEVCVAGVCKAGVAVVCSALDQCHDVGVCDKATGKCSNPAKGDGVGCSDGDACTVGDACGGGLCKGKAVNCDDANVCTDDSCDKVTGCVNLPNSVTCEDGDACSIGDSCSGGKCKAGYSALPGMSVLGGTGQDAFLAVAAHDNGAIAVGRTTAAGAGAKNFWIVDFDQKGDVSWQKSWGGSQNDEAVAVVAVADGFVVAGKAEAEEKIGGATGIWSLVKFSPDGNLIWTRWYGTNWGSGPSDQTPRAASSVAGGFALAGEMQVSGHGNDMALMRTDNQGGQQWMRTYGGSGYENARGLLPLSDGYLLVGETDSKGAGLGDGWVVRTDPSGTEMWNRTYGYSGHEWFMGAAAAKGGYVLAGATYSIGSGLADVWLVRTDEVGVPLWERTYGGSAKDHSFAILGVGDTFALSAQSESYGAGGYDAWLILLDGNGNLQKTTVLGTSQDDRAAALGIYKNGFMFSGFWGMAADSTSKGWLLRTDFFQNMKCSDSGPCSAKLLSDCDDKNPCTADLCDAAHNGCYHTNLPDWSPCGTGLVCDGSGVCGDVKATKGMAFIPAGTFKMGCVPGDTKCNSDEEPQHNVTLDAFYMDVDLVTVAKYKACVGAGKCTSQPTHPYSTYSTNVQSAMAQHPVTFVTWSMSVAYCKNALEYGGRGALPTEAQWEKAARGGLVDMMYPWGIDEPTTEPGLKNTVCMFAGCGGAATTCPVTTSSPNGYGLRDMVGNAWTWIADWYVYDYYATSPVSNPIGPVTGGGRVTRGPGCASSPLGFVASRRHSMAPSCSDCESSSFRCARPYP